MSQRTNIIAELKAKIQKYTAILEQGKKFNFQPVIDKASKKIQDAKTKLAIERGPMPVIWRSSTGRKIGRDRRGGEVQRKS